ncbi:MAG TPA: LysR substrate-binding domain-containing protein [Polyangiaceae bacterium]|nr:LysR substrate-binding domain-containing protein [Polyangiaceae bacterium]
MELRHLRYFSAIAEERHFGRAAERLGIAQPPLSKQLQDLERELGYPLFDRSRRPIELTAAGQALFEHTRGIFAGVEAAVREARRAGAGHSGRLAIGYPTSLAYSGLSTLLRAFRERSPEVAIEVRELSPGEQIEALKRGDLDVGFVRTPLHEPELASENIRNEKLVLALPVDHRLAIRERVALSAAANEPFVFFPRARGPGFFDFLMGFCRDSGFTPHIVQEAPQIDVLALVAAGFGLSIFPDSVREFRRADIVLRPIIGSPTTELRVAWRSGDASPAVARFIETVRKVGVKRGRRPRS